MGLIEGCKRWLCGPYGRVCLAVVALLVIGGDAWATAPAGCTSMGSATGGSAPTFSNVVGCVMDTIGVYTVLAALIAVIVPLLVIMWGLRSGTSLISALYRKAAGALGRH